ncbi:MAG: DUF6515 family protein [Pseudomonadota bacterium]
MNPFPNNILKVAGLAALLLGLAGAASAASNTFPNPHDGRHQQQDSRVDNRYNHNRSYPARGYSTYQLPRGYYTSRYRGSPYYFHGGAWYRPYGRRYVVVAPPFGLGLRVLPPFYTTVWFGGSPYYYADDTYYVYRPERREYVVTEPPRGQAEVGADPGGSEEIFVYPKNGQGEEQQSTDRYECHRWAVEKTGFDPTRPSGNVAESAVDSKRADYRRAEGACLEARGYSVK